MPLASTAKFAKYFGRVPEPLKSLVPAMGQAHYSFQHQREPSSRLTVRIGTKVDLFPRGHKFSNLIQQQVQFDPIIVVCEESAVELLSL